MFPQPLIQPSVEESLRGCPPPIHKVGPGHLEMQLLKMCLGAGEAEGVTLGPSPAGRSLGVALGNSGQEGGMSDSKDHSEGAKGRESVLNQVLWLWGHLLRAWGHFKPPLKMDLLEQGYGPESLSPPGVQSQRKPEALPCDHCFPAKVTEFCVL